VAGPRLDASTGSPPLGAIPNHNLQAGTNRIVILAVASETAGEGNQGSRPDTVTYGGTAMLQGPFQFNGGGPDTYWAPDIHLYYLTDASGLSGTGNRAIVIDGNPNIPYSGSPGLMIAEVVQFNGVRQTNPFGADARRYTQDDTVAGTLDVTITGSRIYAFATGLWPSPLVATASPEPTALLPSTADLNGGGTLMRAASVLVGGGSETSLPAVAPPGYTVSWSSNSLSLAHVAVVLVPASQ
jgi:hypothetical protein